jgi:hypothetical protein
VAQPIGGDALDGGEIGRRTPLANAAFVVVEYHVHHPMMAVLDLPVAADRLHLYRGVGCERGNTKAGLAISLAADDVAHDFDHDDRVQSGPVVTLFQPIDFVDRRRGAAFYSYCVTKNMRLPRLAFACSDGHRGNRLASATAIMVRSVDIEFGV